MNIDSILTNILYLLVAITLMLFISGSFQKSLFRNSVLIDQKKLLIVLEFLLIVSVAIAVFILAREYYKVF
jgi:hypothetical protein